MTGNGGGTETFADDVKFVLLADEPNNRCCGVGDACSCELFRCTTTLPPLGDEADIFWRVQVMDDAIERRQTRTNLKKRENNVQYFCVKPKNHSEAKHGGKKFGQNVLAPIS